MLPTAPDTPEKRDALLLAFESLIFAGYDLTQALITAEPVRVEYLWRKGYRTDAYSILRRHSPFVCLRKFTLPDRF